jgi:hypothetical protein
MVSTPGTSKVKHPEENTSVAVLELDDSIMGELGRLKSTLGHAVTAA